MGKTRNQPPPPGAAVAPADSNPFAALAALRGTLPAGSNEESQPRASATHGTGKVVITRERKGRGGKTVTLVRGLAMPTAALADLARDMRHALGTGGTLEDETVVLNGDQSQRAADWLRQRGLLRVVIGN